MQNNKYQFIPTTLKTELNKLISLMNKIKTAKPNLNEPHVHYCKLHSASL